MPSEEEDDEGGKLDSRQIKKFVKIANSKPLAFAFCPGKGKEDPTFMIDRRKKPKNLGKGAKSESGQAKVAYGTISAKQKTLTFSCEKPLPGMEKVMKKYLRGMKLQMDVEVKEEGAEE